MANTAKKLTVTPLRPANFGLIIHRVREFSATVPGAFSVAELEDSNLWANVAGQMEMGSEVRCIADDMSFVARGICTFSQGALAKIRIYQFTELDKVDYDTANDAASDYAIKLCGPLKWCIVQKSTGDRVKEGIDKQVDAMRELEDYQRALRS